MARWLMIVWLVGGGSAVAGEVYQLFKQGKMYWYKEDWANAAETYQTLIQKYPDSPFYVKSVYHLAYCRYNLGQKMEAFDLLSDFVETRSSSEHANLVEDAKSLRLRIAYDLAPTKPFMENVLKESLKDPCEDIAFQAASWLAKLGDPAGLDVLFRALQQEHDTDLRGKAIKDIMRVGDDDDRARLDEILKKQRQQKGDEAPKMLRLVRRDLKTNQETIKINLPISLFSIIVKSLSAEELKMIADKNVDLNQIADDLKSLRSQTVIFEIVNQDEEIKLFLD